MLSFLSIPLFSYATDKFTELCVLHGFFFSNVLFFYQFSQGGLTLDSREEYGADIEKYHHAYLEFGVSVGRLLGGDNSTHQKMEAIYQFEKRIAEVIKSKLYFSL